MEHAAIQILLLLLTGCLVALVARRFRVPYTLALVVAGVLLGFVEVEELEVFHLTGEVLFTFLLPALLFEAAFHLDLESFRRNAVPILTLAIGGVAISAGMTGLLLYGGLVSTGLAPAAPVAGIALFAVVIAATDPISVLALFKTLGVPRRLYLLVEGESLLNDGLAVVLFLIVAAVFGVDVGHGGHTELHGPAEIFTYGVRTFVVMAAGGVLVGAAVGTFLSALMRQFEDRLVEITLTTVVAYGSFLVAEELHCSGVLSTVTAGVVTGSFGARYGMSTRTRLAVEDFWEYAAFVANTLVFLLMGLILRIDDLVGDGGTIALAFLTTVIARGVATYGLWPVLRAAGTDLPWSWSHVLVWGGLRGSLSMVLVLGIDPSWPHRDFLIHLVFGTVSASLFLQGLTISGLLARLGLSSQRDDRRLALEVERGRVLAMAAAQEELHHLHTEGLVDGTIASRLGDWLKARRDEAEARTAAQLGAREDLADQRTAEALVRLLDAEREAIRHATRLEVVEQDAAQEVLQSIDRDLADLREALHEGEPKHGLEQVLGRQRVEEG
ncbi:MAG: cation:proton antiporter [Myxococcales bacterium]|nr:cation:proton antiporter [Myxococcales bacterium]MCB9672888.1 cation:proton antiporter [Alphaproteobacteria bacterium]